VLFEADRVFDKPARPLHLGLVKVCPAGLLQPSEYVTECLCGDVRRSDCVEDEAPAPGFERLSWDYAAAKPIPVAVDVNGRIPSS
jgi:hypothetical protein